MICSIKIDKHPKNISFFSVSNGYWDIILPAACHRIDSNIYYHQEQIKPNFFGDLNRILGQRYIQ